MKYIKLFNEHNSYEDFTGTTAFVKPNVSVCKSPKEVHYTPEPYNWGRHHFTIQTLSANTTITVSYPSNLTTTDYTYMEYSLDSGNTWTRKEKGSDVGYDWTVFVANPQDVLFRGSGNTMCLAIESQGAGTRYFPIYFSSDLPFNVFGNIHSLLRPETYFTDQIPLNEFSFYGLFSNSKVVDASNLILPATTLANHCYRGMFSRCTSLTTAPELPATTLTNYCYGSMFYGCTSLTTAPELPATTLANYCYSQMFFNCTSLNSITCLATNISATGCTTNWVSGVAASGTFTKADGMTSWTTGVNGMPTGWTVVDA